MTRRAKIWMAVAAGFTVVNLAGAVYAGIMREQAHCLIHVVLTFGGAYLMWLIASRSREQALSVALPTHQRLDQLQQSIDAVALETERIGEAQRFEAKVRAEKADQARRGDKA